MRHDPQPGDSPRRLVLVRHGRSAHRHNGWVAIEGFRRWREAYEAAALREEGIPMHLVADAAELFPDVSIGLLEAFGADPAVVELLAAQVSRGLPES